MQAIGNIYLSINPDLTIEGHSSRNVNKRKNVIGSTGMKKIIKILFLIGDYNIYNMIHMNFVQKKK